MELIFYMDFIGKSDYLDKRNTLAFSWEEEYSVLFSQAIPVYVLNN